MSAELSQLLMRTVVTLGAAALANRRQRRQEPAAAQISLQPPAMPALPGMPTLPGLPGYAAPVQPAQAAPRPVPGLALTPQPLAGAETLSAAASTEDAGVARSYAAELENPAVACLPCTRGHLSAVAAAAEEAVAALQRGASWETREQLARIAGEIQVMRAYDWQPEKLAAADPRHRQVLEATMPEVQPLLQEVPQAPDHLVLAWAAVDESLRFARSPQPTDLDRAEIRQRLVDAEKALNYAEREQLAPHRLAPEQRDLARDALPLIRKARHTLTMESGSLEALERAEVLLSSAVVALTPEPTPEQCQALANKCRAVHEGFYGRLFEGA